VVWCTGAPLRVLEEMRIELLGYVYWVVFMGQNPLWNNCIIWFLNEKKKKKIVISIKKLPRSYMEEDW
jgi:hypothetical protein